jgi:hypothetical protein
MTPEQFAYRLQCHLCRYFWYYVAATAFVVSMYFIAQLGEKLNARIATCEAKGGIFLYGKIVNEPVCVKLETVK